MKADYKYVVASIFYNRAQFHELIKYAIVPFLQADTNYPVIKNYFIHLRSNRGEHISLHVEFEEDIEMFTQNMLRHFNKYLKNNQSAIREVKYPLDCLFDNYPNNSIHFNIEKFSIPLRKEISDVINQAIIKGLAAAEIDSDIIFSFLLYMHMGLLRAMYNNPLAAYIEIDEIKEYIISEVLCTKSDDNIFLHEEDNNGYLCLENDESLEDISKDIWGLNMLNDELDWLKHWVSDCSRLVNDYKPAQKYSIISRHLFNHLGLDDNNLSSLILNMCQTGLKILTQTKPYTI